MIYGLLATGYKEQSSQIQRAISGLKSLIYEQDGLATLENSTSTLWDTALLSYSIQASGVSCRDPMIAAASRFLLKRQHAKKLNGRFIILNQKLADGDFLTSTPIILITMTPQQLSGP